MGPLRYSELGYPACPPPQIEPSFVTWWADSVDTWWDDAGQPDPYTVIHAGAGDGSAARDLLGRGPRCLSALRLVLVEPGYANQHALLLPVEPPTFLFPSGPPDPFDLESEPPPASGIGPLVTSLDDLPDLDGTAAVVATGWLSRLPSDRFEWRQGRWSEIRLAASPTADGGLVEMPVPLPEGPTLSTGFGLAPGLTGRYPLLVGAVEWLIEALRSASDGVVAVVDRWTERTEPVPPPDPSTPANPSASCPPLALDQLASVRRPLGSAPIEVSPGVSAVTWRIG